MQFAFFGSSLVSAYWNGAATYYRGLLKALSDRGHSVAFYEPDAFERQAHRDMEDPDWAAVTVFEPSVAAMERALATIADLDRRVWALYVSLDQPSSEPGPRALPAANAADRAAPESGASSRPGAPAARTRSAV